GLPSPPASSCSSLAGSNAFDGAGTSGVSAGGAGLAGWTAVFAGLLEAAAVMTVGSGSGLPQSVPIAKASAKLLRSNTVDVFSHDCPPGQPLTLGGANNN